MKRRCPACGHHWTWKLSDGRIKCRRCKRRYRITTVWESCRLSNAAKCSLLNSFVLGVPVYRLRFRGPASQPTIQRFFRLIRATLAFQEGCRKPFHGIVECDESPFGGRRRGKRGWGAAGKIIVLGIMQRDGKVRTFPIQGRGKEQILPLIKQVTRPGCLYYTDDWHAYGSLAVRGDHVVVTKKKGVPKGRNHINGIEGFWSYAKHWLYHYRGVPKKFFHHYLGETSYRFNNRKTDLYPLIYGLLHKIDASKIVNI